MTTKVICKSERLLNGNFNIEVLIPDNGEFEQLQERLHEIGFESSVYDQIEINGILYNSLELETEDERMIDEIKTTLNTTSTMKTIEIRRSENEPIYDRMTFDIIDNELSSLYGVLTAMDNDNPLTSLVWGKDNTPMNGFNFELNECLYMSQLADLNAEIDDALETCEIKIDDEDFYMQTIVQYESDWANALVFDAYQFIAMYDLK